MVFWSTIAFAFTGIEAGSFMGDEIVDPRRTIPRAILVAGITIAAIYILGTLAILLALPQSEITGLGGIMDAITATGRRIGITGLAPAAAILIVLSGLGGVGVWLAATARLPFVAGLDRYLPQAFGKLHPKYGTPHVALLLQAAVAAFCTVLGQAGETPKQAYEILVSLGVVAFFLPYLVMFAALIRLQWIPSAPGALPMPGGKPAAICLGALGFATSVAAILLACVPPAGEADPRRYVIKVVGLSALLVASGVVAWVVGSAPKPARQ
jgi:amino acid transporter